MWKFFTCGVGHNWGWFTCGICSHMCRFCSHMEIMFTSKIPASEQLTVCGDWNGHIGSQSTGFEEVHGGQAIGKRNTEGERILEFAFANELVVGNTWFKKKPEHLVTYQSGNAAAQIDFILYRRSFRKQVSNVKVILGEECASQHRLLVGDFRVSIPPQPKRKFVPRIKVW